MDAQPPHKEDHPYDLEKVTLKQKKRISVLEKQLMEAMQAISMLEIEVAEHNTPKKKGDYAIIFSIGSTFLDKMMKKKKSYLNKYMRPVFNALLWELWRDYLGRIVDGDDKVWAIEHMDVETGVYNEGMAQEFFQHVFDIYRKRIANGEITAIADDGTDLPVPVATAVVQSPIYNMSTLFRFGYNANVKDAEDEENIEENIEENTSYGAKGG
jgi:hypothetical protein